MNLVLLGDLRFDRSDPKETNVLPSPKYLAVLAFLACQPARRASRHKLQALLWGENDPNAAADSLRQALHQIRKIDRTVVISDRAALVLNTNVRADRDAFVVACANGDVSAAVHAYTGDFCGDIMPRSGEEFRFWAEGERTRLRREYFNACRQLLQDLLRKGERARAASTARKILESAGSELSEEPALVALRSITDGLLAETPTAIDWESRTTSLAAAQPLAHTNPPDCKRTTRAVTRTSASPRLWSKRAIGAVVLLLIIAVTALRAALVRTQVEPHRLVVVAKDSSGALWRATIKIPSATSKLDEPLIVHRRQFERFSVASRVLPWAMNPHSGVLAFVAPDPSGETRIELSPSSLRTAVLSVGSENHAPDWSPDGQRIVFASDGAYERTTGHAHLVEATLASGVYRQLTFGPGRDETPKISPDQSRIAFVRRSFSGSPHRICWIESGSRTPQCDASADSLLLDAQLIGWRDSETLVVRRSYANGAELRVVRLTDGEEETLAQNPLQASISPDGELVMCLCLQQGVADASWKLLSARTASLARQVRLEGFAPENARFFWRARRSNTHSSQLRIASRISPLRVGDTLRARIVSLSAQESVNGRNRISWRSSDTAILGVGPAGEALGRKEGTAYLTVDRNARPVDSILVSVVPVLSGFVLQESWASDWLTRWQLFGDPKPVVRSRQLTGDSATFLPNGDGAFESGAYSVASWDPVHGFGIEVAFRAPITADRSQRIRILIGSHWETEEARHWDRTSGHPPIEERARRLECGFSYPLLEGERNMRRAGFSHAGTIRPVDIPLAAARSWHVVSLQVHGDGQCSGTLDGGYNWRSRNAAPLNRRYRITLMGASVGTTVEVGTVRAWTGDRYP